MGALWGALWYTPWAYVALVEHPLHVADSELNAQVQQGADCIEGQDGAPPSERARS